MFPSFLLAYVLQNVAKKSKMLRKQVETSVDWFLTLIRKGKKNPKKNKLQLYLLLLLSVFVLII